MENFLEIEKTANLIYQKSDFLDVELQQKIIGQEIGYVPKYNSRGLQKLGFCWPKSKWVKRGEFFRDLTKPKKIL